MEKNMLRLGVIGYGYWGPNIVRNFHALAALRMVCDSNDQILATLSNQYNNFQVTTSFEDTLGNSAIKGVVIANTAVYHAQMSK